MRYAFGLWLKTTCIRRVDRRREFSGAVWFRRRGTRREEKERKKKKRKEEEEDADSQHCARRQGQQGPAPSRAGISILRRAADCYGFVSCNILPLLRVETNDVSAKRTTPTSISPLTKFDQKNNGWMDLRSLVKLDFVPKSSGRLHRYEITHAPHQEKEKTRTFKCMS